MDAVLFISLALVFTVMLMYKQEPSDASAEEIIAEDTTRVAKLNDSYYEDTDAFSEIIHALGFPKTR